MARVRIRHLCIYIHGGRGGSPPGRITPDKSEEFPYLDLQKKEI